MKRLHVSVMCILILCIVVVLSGIPVSAASIVDDSGVVADSVMADDVDLVSYFQQYPCDDKFGGIYRDGDTLVVNYVGKHNELVVPFYAMDTDIKVEYHSVQYSLKELEEVKDYLSSVMVEYGIELLDADEATNLVDVELCKLTEETVENITALVNEKFGYSDFLNFVDLEGATIETTVAYERPQYKYLDFINDNGIETRAMTMVYQSIHPIQINSQYLTLGLAVSQSLAYSAGHAMPVGLQYPVYSAMYSVQIGTATSHYGGTNGDWSSIARNGAIGTYGPVVGIRTATKGDSVYMWGAVSGITSGVVTDTYVTINSDGTILNGMFAASYSCELGDSGAGIFNSTYSGTSVNNIYAYGIQSSRGLNTDGSWNGKSYFTPFPLP